MPSCGELSAPRLDNVDFETLRQTNTSNQLSNEILELSTDLPRLAGNKLSIRQFASG